jgi:hypothetical protein
MNYWCTSDNGNLFSVDSQQVQFIQMLNDTCRERAEPFLSQFDLLIKRFTVICLGNNGIQNHWHRLFWTSEWQLIMCLSGTCTERAFPQLFWCINKIYSLSFAWVTMTFKLQVVLEFCMPVECEFEWH